MRFRPAGLRPSSPGSPWPEINGWRSAADPIAVEVGGQRFDRPEGEPLMAFLDRVAVRTGDEPMTLLY